MNNKFVLSFLIILFLLSHGVPVYAQSSGPNGPEGTPDPRTPQIQPVPEAPMSAELKYAVLSKAYEDFVYRTGGGDATFERFLQSHIIIGAESYSVGELLGSISADEWKRIGVGLSALVFVKSGCSVPCSELFWSLWWAASHFRTGYEPAFVQFPQDPVSNHPNPIICGSPVSWERVVDLLDYHCTSEYRVRWGTHQVRVEERISNFSIDPQAVAIAAGVAGTAFVVGVVVFTSGGSLAPLALILVIP